MSTATKLGRKVALVIPDEFYRTFDDLRTTYGDGQGHDGYRTFVDIVEKLEKWLLDQTKQFGYRTAAFRVVDWGYRDRLRRTRVVIIQESDNPLDASWGDNIVGRMVDYYGLSELWDQFRNER